MPTLQKNQTARISVRFMNGESPYSVKNASDKKIILKTPSGTSLEEDGVFLTDGDDGIIYYDAAYGYLNEHGAWEVQGFADKPDWKGRTRRGSFNVEDNI